MPKQRRDLTNIRWMIRDALNGLIVGLALNLIWLPPLSITGNLIVSRLSNSQRAYSAAP